MTVATPSPAAAPAYAAAQQPMPVRRIDSASLLADGQEVEIAHAGRIDRLRVTQLNKLILTA